MSPDVHALAGAYAVDALPADERAFFERHLAACEACQREVDELTATAAMLATAAAEPPPPDLRARVLADVNGTRQLAPETAPSRGASRWQRLQPVLVPAAAAVAVVLLVLGGVTGMLLGRIGSLEERLAQSEHLTAVLVDPALQVVEMEGTSGAVARLLHAPGSGRAVVVVEGLGPVTAERTYQLWVLRDGAPIPDQLFRPDEQGRAVVAIDRPVAGTDGVAATVEPAGGSPQPTGDIVLHVELGT